MHMTRQEAESLLFQEARLLDERRFEEWLALFSDDCNYWVPILDADPNTEPSIIYDDRARLEERVYRLLHTPAYAQDPPSRTQHNVTNVEVFEGDTAGEAIVLCNLTLFELRTGDFTQAGLGDQRMLAARCEYVFSGAPDRRIKLKKLWLINRDLPIYNLSFIL